MKRLLSTAVIFAALAVSAQAGEPEAVAAAKTETLAWLALTDSGEYESSWDAASALFKAAISKEDWKRSLSAARTPFGGLKAREMATAKFSTTLPGAPDGEYVVFQFNASFEHKATAIETVTAMKDADETWRVVGYFIK